MLSHAVGSSGSSLVDLRKHLIDSGIDTGEIIC